MSANPWTRRFLLAGLIGLVLGIGVVSVTWGDFEELADPTRTNIAVIEPGEVIQIDLIEHEYVAYSYAGEDEIGFNMTGDAGEVEKLAPNQWTGSGVRSDQGGRMMDAFGVYHPDAGVYNLSNSGANLTLYLVDNTALNEPSMATSLLYAGCFGVVCGLTLLPIAGLIHIFSKPKPEAPTHLVQSGGENVPTTEEVWLAVQKGEPLTPSEVLNPEIEAEPEVAPPFATRIEVETVFEKPTPAKPDQEADGDWKSWDEG